MSKMTLSLSKLVVLQIFQLDHQFVNIFGKKLVTQKLLGLNIEHDVEILFLIRCRIKKKIENQLF